MKMEPTVVLKCSGTFLNTFIVIAWAVPQRGEISSGTPSRMGALPSQDFTHTSEGCQPGRRRLDTM